MFLGQDSVTGVTQSSIHSHTYLFMRLTTAVSPVVNTIEAAREKKPMESCLQQAHGSEWGMPFLRSQRNILWDMPKNLQGWSIYVFIDFLAKDLRDVPYNPVIPLLGEFLDSVSCPRDSCSVMFTAAPLSERGHASNPAVHQYKTAHWKCGNIYFLPPKLRAAPTFSPLALHLRVLCYSNGKLRQTVS